jgi:hypothetical protein
MEPITPDELGPWQFSLRGLMILTTVVACACSLVAWWGVLAVVAALGAALGAFCVALICPWIGCDVVLDRISLDIVKCLGLGAYIVGGAWATFAGLRWLVVQANGPGASVFVPGGVTLLFVLTARLFAKALWPLVDDLETVLVTLGSCVGAIVALLLYAAAF